jgi:hypothetical protein
VLPAQFLGAALRRPEGGEGGVRGAAEEARRPGQRVDVGGELALLLGPAAVAAAGVGDLAQVALPPGRDDVLARVRRPDPFGRGARPVGGAEAPVDLGHELGVQRVDPAVVEVRRARPEDGQGLPVRVPQLVVALVLLAHVAERVLRAPPGELVDDDEVRVVEHLDLLELARGAELRRHHVEGEVRELRDLRVALPDARRLDEDHVEAAALLHRREDVLGRVAHLPAGAPGRQ